MKKASKAVLYMAANTLGPNSSPPLESLKVLQTADLLVFEEHRHARQALKAAGIHREYLRLTEHAEQATISEVEASFSEGKTVCYMSDQGTPVLADPGQALLALAYRLGATVRVIPGPSSITAAVAACPFISKGFHFAGFLPRASQERVAALTALQPLKVPVIILDTPYRLKALMADCLQHWPTKDPALLALDISGDLETYLLAPIVELEERAQSLKKKLNFVLILPPIH